MSRVSCADADAASLDDRARSAIGTAIWAAVSIALSSTLVWYYHDQSWYPPDDGNYAHVAQRVMSGEILNLQVQDVHAGYINFLNAAALGIFGLDLVSLRYPLGCVAVLQASLIYVLIAPRDRAAALVAAVASITLGVIQFFNPTAHWYCGALTVALIVWMTRGPRHATWRYVGAGIFIGLIALFRQPSGLWVGMGVLSVSLAAATNGAAGLQTLYSRSLIALMLAVLVAYAIATGEPFGALLIASPPAAILAWMFVTSRTSNRATIGIVARLATGAMIAAVPLVAYHVVNNSISSWVHDIVITPATLTKLDFFGRNFYAAAVIAGAYQAVSNLEPNTLVNGLYWTAIPLLPLINSVGIFRSLQAKDRIDNLTLPIIAAFYALVSLHFQIPIYLYYSAGVCLAAIVWQHAFGSRLRRTIWTTAAAGLAIVATVYHAGQPYSRTSLQILQGLRRTTPLAGGFERCGLRLDKEDREVYKSLILLIQREVPASGSIFAVPSDAELYFLASRRNPFRFYNTALGIQTSEDMVATMDLMTTQPPTVVTFRPKDKYNTPASWRIIEEVRARYDFIATIGEIEVYRLRR
jgi:hypothetical protein